MRISPFGVKTYTSSAPIWVRSEARNSSGSRVSACQSITERSQAGVACTGAWPATWALYRQCAATPYSAWRCISCVRIWISTGLPPGTITVVCRERYMFSFGTAM